MTDEGASGATHLQTPSQTIGPFFGYALPYVGGPELVPAHLPTAITLFGTVFDGAGDPIPDALIEIWQADEKGVLPEALGSLDRDGREFTGFGRCPTTRAGHYGFTTVKPGPVEGKAPYILVTVFARGMPIHLFTRVYFADEIDLNAADAVLGAIPEERRSTLLAVQEKSGEYRFDIRIQGDGETVFLDFDA